MNLLGRFIHSCRYRLRIAISVSIVHAVFAYWHWTSCQNLLEECKINRTKEAAECLVRKAECHLHEAEFYFHESQFYFLKIGFCFKFVFLLNITFIVASMIFVSNFYSGKPRERSRVRHLCFSGTHQYERIRKDCEDLRNLFFRIGDTKHKRLVYKEIDYENVREEYLFRNLQKRYIMYCKCISPAEKHKLRLVSLEGNFEFFKSKSCRCFFPKLWNNLPFRFILAVISRMYCLVEAHVSKLFVLDMCTFVSDIDDVRFWENNRTREYEKIVKSCGVVVRFRAENNQMKQLYEETLSSMINMKYIRQRIGYDLKKNTFDMLLPCGVAVSIVGPSLPSSEQYRNVIENYLGKLTRGRLSQYRGKKQIEYDEIENGNDQEDGELKEMTNEMLNFLSAAIREEAKKEREEGIPMCREFSILLVPPLSHVLRILFDFVFGLSAIMPVGCARKAADECIITTTTCIFLAAAVWELFVLDFIKRNKEKSNMKDPLLKPERFIELYNKMS